MSPNGGWLNRLQTSIQERTAGSPSSLLSENASVDRHARLVNTRQKRLVLPRGQGQGAREPVATQQVAELHVHVHAHPLGAL